MKEGCNEMSNETPDGADWGLHPTRREARGEFPGHERPVPRPVLTLAQATHRAADRLAEWIETHGYPPGGAR